MVLNKQWLLGRTPPEQLPTDGDFKLIETPLPTPGPNQMLTRTIYLSLDPYQWGRRRGGVEAVGEVCHGRTVAQVVQSNIADYQDGDIVFNTNGWQEYGLTGEGISIFNYMFPRFIDPSQAPISTAVGVLGMLGLTAYSGIYLQCEPKSGETVVVSAASGGVGQVVGQIAKIFGCHVVGIAGAQEKCDFVTGELGLDACVSHRSESLAVDLQAACPEGIDIYFENVGGKVFDAVLPQLNSNARISLCGLISQYGSETFGDPHANWFAKGQSTFDRLNVQAHRLTVGNFARDYQAQFLSDMAGWIQAGKVKYKEDLWPGLEKAPQAFRAMMEGGNFGKTIVAVGDDPTLDDTIQARRASTDVLGITR